MNTPPSDLRVVDAVFPVHGQALLRDHALALRQALGALWPWLETDAVAAIHPLKLVPGNDELALLSQRTRLLLRVQEQRMDELAATQGLELNLLGQPVRLGTPQRRDLRPHSAMYAYRVAADAPDEAAFMARVGRDMAELGISAARVCGRRQSMAMGGRTLDTFSLLLHEMVPEHALRLQQFGLGSHRLLGCGVFVPHKSAAAV